MIRYRDMTPEHERAEIGNVLSIDPGKNGCYWCFWDQGRMLYCGITTEPLHIPSVDVVLVERMQVRMGKHSDDLLDVHGCACRVTATFARDQILWTTPSTWKGQVPKEVHQRTRILPNIRPDEMRRIEEAVPRKSDRHNMYDAYGIGLWYYQTKGIR